MGLVDHCQVPCRYPVLIVDVPDAGQGAVGDEDGHRAAGPLDQLGNGVRIGGHDRLLGTQAACRLLHRRDTDHRAAPAGLTPSLDGLGKELQGGDDHQDVALPGGLVSDVGSGECLPRPTGRHHGGAALSGCESGQGCVGGFDLVRTQARRSGCHVCSSRSLTGALPGPRGGAGDAPYEAGPAGSCGSWESGWISPVVQGV